MKKFIPNWTKPLVNLLLLLVSLSLLITFIVVPVEKFPDWSISDTDLVLKIFSIIYSSMCTLTMLITTIKAFTYEIKLIKRLRYVRNTLNDDNALFFYGKFELENDVRYYENTTFWGIFWFILFGVIGLFFYTLHLAIKKRPNKNRVYLLYQDGLHVFEVDSKSNFLCKRGSIKNPEITTDGKNVIIKFQNKKLSYTEKNIVLTLNIKKSEMTISELKQKLEDLFPTDVAVD